MRKVENKSKNQLTNRLKKNSLQKKKYAKDRECLMKNQKRECNQRKNEITNHSYKKKKK